jgi:hypothetical protein
MFGGHIVFAPFLIITSPRLFEFLSSNFVGISTVVCGSLWGFEKISGRCHGNQGAKNVKFTPIFTKFCTVNIPTMFQEA